MITESNINKFEVISINNHHINLRKIAKPYKISRFIRDPRDLVVSGYFYHKRGAEAWTKIKSPKEKDWKIVNGNIPKVLLKSKLSYYEYLNDVTLEEGLIAEIEFRKFHFDSMMKWTEENSVKLYRYEDIIGNEGNVFKDLFKFYGFNLFHQYIAEFYANKYSKKSYLSKNKHVRNPKTGQWKSIFNDEIVNYFNFLYKDLLMKYDYNIKQI